MKRRLKKMMIVSNKISFKTIYSGYDSTLRLCLILEKCVQILLFHCFLVYSPDEIMPI